jgi:cytochrome c5
MEQTIYRDNIVAVTSVRVTIGSATNHQRRVAGKNDPTVLPQVKQQFHVVNHGAKNVDKTLSHCRASEKSFSAPRAGDDHDNSPR